MKALIKRGSKGFTLIELLVVIAIIGLLASIILVSLNSARNKGKDTRVISDVNQIRTQIESEASAGGTYQVAAANCITANPAAANGSATINAAANNCATLNTDSTNNGGTVTVRSNTAVGTSATTFTAYMVYGLLNSTQYYCVDSTGNTKTSAAAPAAGITC